MYKQTAREAYRHTNTNINTYTDKRTHRKYTHTYIHTDRRADNTHREHSNIGAGRRRVYGYHTVQAAIQRKCIHTTKRRTYVHTGSADCHIIIHTYRQSDPYKSKHKCTNTTNMQTYIHAYMHTVGYPYIHTY